MKNWLEKLDEDLALIEHSYQDTKICWPIPKNVRYLASEIRFVNTLDAIWSMTETLLSLDISVLGIDTEFTYGNQRYLKKNKDGSSSKSSKKWFDIRSVKPLLLSLAAVVDDTIIVYVVDLRVEGVGKPIHTILNSGVKVAVHYLKAEFHCLKTLGVNLPETIYDTSLSAMALNLGKYHRKYVSAKSPGSDETENNEVAIQKKHYHSSLLALCIRYGIEHKFSLTKERLRLSFDKVGPLTDFTQEQIDYAAEDAVVTVQIFPHQMIDLLKADLLSHMEKVEFPYALANAECEWNGVKISQENCMLALKGLNNATKQLETEFIVLGVKNPNSSNEIKRVFQEYNILHNFTSTRHQFGFSFSSENLKKNRSVHAVVDKLYRYKKYKSKLSERIFKGEYISADGRVHASLDQLGADTGRTTSTKPSLNSIGKIFRPIVVPEAGYLIGEADLCQIEMGVVAALSGDQSLIEAYNTGNVYFAAAKRFYANKLNNLQLSYTVDECKTDPETKRLRNIMKIFCLGVLYNMSPKGVAKSLGISETQAKLEIEKFFNLYPVLKDFMEKQSLYGGQRGYARSVTGLKRFRAQPKEVCSLWEINWLRNMPIQSSAADLFKRIVINLNLEYKKHGAKLILQVYDAVVFEVPKENFDFVARKTKQIMEETVEEMFPALRGQADLNIENPTCWNKDGITDSIQRFLLDPEYKNR